MAHSLPLKPTGHSQQAFILQMQSEPLPVPTLPPSNPFSSDLALLRELHDSDKHFAASRLLAAIDSHLQQPSTPHLQKLRNALSTPYFIRVRKECREIHTLRTALHSNTGWIPSYTGESTKVWYRREEGTASHSILTEGVIRAPLINVAALIYEADLYTHLFWYVTSACAFPVPTKSLLKRAAHLSISAPWPLHNRDVAVYAYAVDALDKEDGGNIMVVSRSLDQNDGVKGIPEPPSKTVRVDMHGSGFELVPIEPGLVRAKFLYNVNPRLSFVPMGLINWVARTLCRWSLRVVESRARDLSKMPKDYEERLASSPVYDRIRGRLNQYWLSKGITPEEAHRHEKSVSQQGRVSGAFDPNKAPPGPSAGVITSIVRGERDEPGVLRRKTSVLSSIFQSAA